LSRGIFFTKIIYPLQPKQLPLPPFLATDNQIPQPPDKRELRGFVCELREIFLTKKRLPHPDLPKERREL